MPEHYQNTTKVLCHQHQSRHRCRHGNCAFVHNLACEWLNKCKIWDEHTKELMLWGRINLIAINIPSVWKTISFIERTVNIWGHRLIEYWHTLNLYQEAMPLLLFLCLVYHKLLKTSVVWGALALQMMKWIINVAPVNC